MNGYYTVIIHVSIQHKYSNVSIQRTQLELCENIICIMTITQIHRTHIHSVLFKQAFYCSYPRLDQCLEVNFRELLWQDLLQLILTKNWTMLQVYRKQMKNSSRWWYILLPSWMQALLLLLVFRWKSLTIFGSGILLSNLVCKWLKWHSVNRCHHVNSWLWTTSTQVSDERQVLLHLNVGIADLGLQFTDNLLARCALIIAVSRCRLNTAQQHSTEHSTSTFNWTQHSNIQLNTAHQHSTEHSTATFNWTHHSNIQLNTAHQHSTEHSTSTFNWTHHSNIQLNTSQQHSTEHSTSTFNWTQHSNIQQPINI